MNETRRTEGGQCRQTQEEKTLCFVCFVLSKTNHRVSFGCRVSGFHHAECSPGRPKSSTAWFLFLCWPRPVLHEGFQSLGLQNTIDKATEILLLKKKKKNKQTKKKRPQA